MFQNGLYLDLWVRYPSEMETFRTFLQVQLAERKKRHPQFSMRAFARWLGLSPAQISQILSGKRPITEKVFQQLAQKFRLSPLEIDQYLSASKPLTTEQQNYRNLSEDAFRLIADWYHLAILTAGQLRKKSADPRWLAHTLGETVQNVQAALERLVRMNLLSVTPELKQVNEPLHLVSEVPSEAIQRFHHQQLDQAKLKLEQLPLDRREFQTLYFVCDEKAIPFLKTKINSFLNEVDAKSSKVGEHLCAMNVQFYTISETKPLPGE